MVKRKQEDQSGWNGMSNKKGGQILTKPGCIWLLGHSENFSLYSERNGSQWSVTRRGMDQEVQLKSFCNNPGKHLCYPGLVRLQ